MQDKKMKTEIVLLAVPAEMLLEAGIFEGDPMQMYVDGNKLVIENLDDVGDIVCEGDCEDCPVDKPTATASVTPARAENIVNTVR